MHEYTISKKLTHLINMNVFTNSQRLQTLFNSQLTMLNSF